MSYNEQLRCDNLTTNHEGALAWRMTPEWELYTTVVTTMGVEDKFYENGEDRVRRIADLVRKVQPEFVAQLAIYTREAMHLRSVPLLLLVELARCHHGDSLVSRAVSKTVQRADEITELLSCYQWRTGKENLSGLSHQLRKGLAESFNHFDEYQFAKYDRKNRKVSLRDALLLVHPKPKDKTQAEVFKKILNRSLDTPYTWETELSRVGQQHFESDEDRDEALKDAWQSLVRSGRLGYMAMLRNLRNMSDLCIDEETKARVCRRLSHADEVRKSKQLPFRFLSAYMQLVNIDESVIESFKSIVDLWQNRSKGHLERRRLYELLDELRYGFHFRWIPRICRYSSSFDVEQVTYNMSIKGNNNLKLPKSHVRKWSREPHQFKTICERDLWMILKWKKMLAHFGKRLLKLNEKNKSFRLNRLMEKIQRRDNRLDAMGITIDQYIEPMLNSLEEAAKISAENIQGFDNETKVLLASDVSGSMQTPVSGNSSVMCYQIGILLSILVKRRCPQAMTGLFGTIWKEYDLPSENVLRNTVMISILLKGGISIRQPWLPMRASTSSTSPVMGKVPSA